MIEFTWETIGGLVFGAEIMDNQDFDIKGDNLKWVVVLHVGILRLVFSKYIMEN
jgi:hypothetical protein